MSLLWRANVASSCKMSAPKKKKTNQRTLNSFFPTLEAANTYNTLQAVDKDNQDSNPWKLW